MIRTKIAGLGHYVPKKVVTNFDLEKIMDTSNEWIIERTGIEERHFIDKFNETTSTIAAKAARIAIERAGIKKEEVDFIVFATLSPDYYFPGAGVMVQRELGITGTEIGALDVRNQCTGFIYALTVADKFIQTGAYKNILVIGAEVHSSGLDMTTRGRNLSVLFGDGAGAMIVQPTEKEGQGILATNLHSDGTYAEKLALLNPGSHGGYFNKQLEEPFDFGFDQSEWGSFFATQNMLDNAMFSPVMDGKHVFKTAVTKFPEAIRETLNDTGYTTEDLDLLVPHQANLRISQFVQRRLHLPDEKIINNIQKYGNTTAASIPIALTEAWENGRVKDGDLISLAAFGSGYTWGAILLRW